MVPIGTDGMRLRNKNKLDCSCHQALPIEPLSDPDLVYFVLFVFFVVNFFLRGEKVFVSVRVRPCGSVANFFLLPACPELVAGLQAVSCLLDCVCLRLNFFCRFDGIVVGRPTGWFLWLTRS